jgi:hypothetical protein
MQKFVKERLFQHLGVCQQYLLANKQGIKQKTSNNLAGDLLWPGQ